MEKQDLQKHGKRKKFTVPSTIINTEAELVNNQKSAQYQVCKICNICGGRERKFNRIIDDSNSV